MRTDADLIVLGAGCAGLALASRLSRYGDRAPRTVILDQRKDYSNDRTWCFWGDEATPFARDAGHQWRCLRISAAGNVVDFDCAETPYRMLGSDIYYEKTLRAIRTNSRMALHLGQRVPSEPEYVNGIWRLETALGRLSARSVVDTRPEPAAGASSALLWQSFYGHEIETASAVFDPTVADLMDFTAASGRQIEFTYLLPLSATRALVELTVFSPSPLARQDLQAALSRAVMVRTGGADHRIVRSEYGLIPMGLPIPAGARNIGPSHVRAGLAAGAARPATGYAFQRLQRWSDDCARAVMAHGVPVRQPDDPFLVRHMDRIFLRVLRDAPELAAGLFVSLFSNVDSPRLIRFLSDQATLRDQLAVISALPSGPFLKRLFAGLGPA